MKEYTPNESYCLFRTNFVNGILFHVIYFIGSIISQSISPAILRGTGLHIIVNLRAGIMRINLEDTTDSKR